MTSARGGSPARYPKERPGDVTEDYAEGAYSPPSKRRAGGRDDWPDPGPIGARPEQGPGAYHPPYGTGTYPEGEEGGADPYGGSAEGQAYEQGGPHRGVHRGELPHPRHRTEWGDMGRSSVYNQPPGAYGAYPSSVARGDADRYRLGPRGYVRSDERIREYICERLTQYHALDVSDVSVEVENGRVTLDGTVPERRMKHVIEDVADDCWGVKDIDNRLRVRRGRQVGQPGAGGPGGATTASMNPGASMSGSASMTPGSAMATPDTRARGAAGESSSDGGHKQQR